jgi:hypothetical protein
MLYWNVQSDFDGEATIEITYFTSGITWSADYLAIADQGRNAGEPAGVRPGLPITAASNMKTPTSGWWSARSISCRKIAELAQMPVSQLEEAGRRTKAGSCELERRQGPHESFAARGRREAATACPTWKTRRRSSRRG